MMDTRRIENAKAIGNRMIEREIERCRKNMGEVEWEKHGDWVIDNIVAAAKQWLSKELMEGRL